ncbi:MAG: polysaccharide deacetylase family protein [Candidatus Amulumruptor caecigallinarius]|nr:polysaccharide deacetylase family protein [Candidatus Amulumruptor caecigallinarius]
MTSIKQKILDKVGKWIEYPPPFYRRAYWRGLFKIKEPPGVKRVYITFDDGPIPESTPWVLDVLDKYNVKATFFMVGDNVRRYPELYEEVKRRGHAVGNHTMHHARGSRKSTKTFVNDVKEAAQYIESDLFRPPHGWMRFAQTEWVHRHYRIVMHDIVTRDYSSLLTSEDVVENVRKYASTGSIIVFHDSLKSLPRLRGSLEPCIKWLKDQGYEMGVIPPKSVRIEKQQ